MRYIYPFNGRTRKRIGMQMELGAKAGVARAGTDGTAAQVQHRTAIPSAGVA